MRRSCTPGLCDAVFVHVCDRNNGSCQSRFSLFFYGSSRWARPVRRASLSSPSTAAATHLVWKEDTPRFVMTLRGIFLAVILAIAASIWYLDMEDAGGWRATSYVFFLKNRSPLFYSKASVIAFSPIVSGLQIPSARLQSQCYIHHDQHQRY
jgi:hypothetical protein